jgi:uncharacterized damage-inducible protein DinB
MDPRIIPLLEMLHLNTRLFRNCLAGLDDPDAQERPSDCINSAAFVAAHLADSRYYILSLLGGSQASPLEGAGGGFNDITKVTSYPPVTEILAAWSGVADLLDQRLKSMTTAELDAPIEPGFLIENQTLLGVLTFMVQHDSYHLGQLGLLRKYAGLPAMAYG